MRSRWRSVAERPELALPQLPKGLERLRRIGKQRESRGRIAPDDHCATFDLVIHPVRRHSERPGQLRDGEGTCHPPRVRLRAMLHEAQLETDTLDRAGQDSGATGRAIAVLRQLSGYLVRAWQVGEGPDSHGDLKRGGLAATPDNAGVNLIAPRPLDDHLVDETTQSGPAQGLTALSHRQGGHPAGSARSDSHPHYLAWRRDHHV